MAGEGDETTPSDYLSQVLDDLIHHFFYFLTCEEAVQTSILARRWRSTWTSCPYVSLYFPDESPQNFYKFSQCVNLVLPRCAARLLRFTVSVPGHDSLMPGIIKCLEFAVQRPVEYFGLTLCDSSHSICWVPESFFRCPVLVSLEIKCCLSWPMSATNWPSLKSLRITGAIITNTEFKKLLSGCPVLECLELKECSALRRIRIGYTALRELVLHSHETGSIGNMVNIRVLSVRKLRLLGDCFSTEFMLSRVTSVVEAEISFAVRHLWRSENGNAQKNLVRGVLQKLLHVKELEIGTWCLQVLSIAAEDEGVTFLLPNCKSLTLNSRLHNGDFLGIARLLASSPNLEKLLIYADDIDSAWNLSNSDSEFGEADHREKLHVGLAKRMKRVQIVGLGDCLELESVLHLVKYLLGDAPLLEQLVLTARRNPTHQSGEKHNPGTMLEFYQQILSLPRASKKVELIFEGAKIEGIIP